MAATFEFKEDTGTVTSSHGTARTGSITTVNWKSIDDSTTAYTSAPIVAGTNSFEKFQYGHFSGTFNTILNCKWAHTATAFGSNLTLKGVVSHTYTTPSQTTNAALTTDMTSAISIGSGAAVTFSTTGPEDASPTSTLTAAGFTTYLITQLQTGSSAAAGDTANVTLSLVYDEN